MKGVWNEFLNFLKQLNYGYTIDETVYNRDFVRPYSTRAKQKLLPFDKMASLLMQAIMQDKTFEKELFGKRQLSLQNNNLIVN